MAARRPFYKLAKLIASIALGLAAICSLLLLYGWLAPPVEAAPLQTAISGDILTDTTWTVAGSPYTVSGVVNVMAKLVIEPGVEVRFLRQVPGSRLEINSGGQLEAIATPTQPITFTSDEAIPAQDDWDGIRFATDALTSTMQYAVIEYAKTGMYLDSGVTFNILSNTFRYIGTIGSDGAVTGSPDNSTIRYNEVYSSWGGIIIDEVGNLTIQDNQIYSIDNTCILITSAGAASSNSTLNDNQIYDCGINGISLQGGAGTGSNNQIVGNTIWNTNREGIYVLNQDIFELRSNTVYSTALASTTASAVLLENVDGATVQDNYLFDNGSTGSYQGAFRIRNTPGSPSLPIVITGTRLKDSNGSGLVFDGANTFSSQTINNNAICVDDRYEIENASTNALTLDATGNWLGTNSPAVGTEITGTVTFNPYIQLTAGVTPTLLPADGLSTAAITITMNDGAGNTVPVGARQVNLATNLGNLGTSSLTLDGNGNGTTTIASTTPGTATITVTEWCGYPVTVTVEFQAIDLAISKSSALTQIIPGELITYTIEYTNNAAVAATNVVVTDTLPAGFQWVSDDALTQGFVSRSFSGQDVIWPRPTLGANVTGTITLVARLPQTATTSCGLNSTNSVVITTTTLDSDPTNNSDSDGGAQVLCADVTLTKIGPSGNITAGTTVTYTLYYTNGGTIAADNVTITDVHPITGGIDTLLSGATLNPGQSGSVPYPVFVDLSICGTGPTPMITNTGFIGTTTPESDSTNNDSSVTNMVQCLPDLVITKTRVSTPTSLGKAITFTIEYENTGVYTAPGAVITDLLPVGVDYVADTFGGAPVTTTSTVVWSLGDLAPGANGSFDVSLKFGISACTGTASFTNTAEIGSTWPDANPADNTDQAGSGSIPCDVDLVVLKNDGVGGPTERPFVLAGDLITYTITYLNVGGQAASGVVLTETLPAYTTFAGPTGANGWYQAGTSSVYTYNVGALASMSGNVLEFVVRVVPTLPATVAVVNNQIEIGGDQADADPNDNVSYEQTPVQAAPDLLVEKVSLSPVVRPGELVTYALTVTNQGSITATNVFITDTLPMSTTYQSNTVIGAPVSTTTNTVVWDVGQFDPGQTTSFDLTLQADAGTSICSDSYLINTVETRGVETEGDYSNNITSTTSLNSPVVACQDLVITKTVTSVAPSFGKVTTFTVTYQNAGVVTMSNVVITDFLDSNVEYVADTQGGAVTTTNTVVWSLGNLVPGAINSFEVGLRAITCTTSVSFTNAVSISSTTPEPYLANNSSQAGPVTISCSDIDLLVLKNDGVGGPTERPFVLAGDLITYTISYVNLNGATATSVVLTETLPAYTTFSGPASWTGGPTIYTRTVSDVPSLGGGVVNFVVRVVPTLPATVTMVYNQVEIGAAQTDVFTADNVSYEQTPVQAVPDLLVEKTALASIAYVNDQITYAITVTNQGSMTATNVVITDTLPTGTSYVTDTTGLSPTIVLNTVVWDLGQLNSGQTLAFTLTLQTNSFACLVPLTNTVEAYGAETEADTSNNVDSTARPNLICEDVGISKSVDTPQTTPDQDVVFTLVYSNPGIFTATNVVVTDTLPGGIDFVASTPPASGPVGGVYSWTIGSLPAGITGTIVVTGHVDAAVACDSVLTNTAGITTTSTDGNALNNEATAAVTVRCGVDLAVLKNDGVGGPTEPPFAQPGDVITYSISYNNLGTGAATNAVITETLPYFTSFAGPTGPNGWFQVGPTRDYTYSLGTVNAGTGGLINFAVQVSTTIPSSGFITNTVCISSADLDVVPTNNCSFEQTQVLDNRPRLNVSKTASPPSGSNVVAGQTITYTVAVLNDGAATANNVVITDTLPLTEVSFITATLSNGNPVNGPNPLTANVISLPVNSAITMTVVVTVNNVATGTIFTNTAEAVADTLAVQLSLPVTHVVTTSTTLTPNLVITKTAVPMSGSVVEPGDWITYTIIAQNNGTNSASNVVISDTLDANVTLVTSNTTTGTLSGPNPIQVSISTLGAGQSVTVTLAVTVANSVSGTIITNQASVTSTESTTLGASGLVTHVINISPTTTLTITKSAIPMSGSGVVTGTTITYTVSVVNNGPATAQNVVITDTLPLTEVSFVTATVNPGGPVNWSGSNPLTAPVGDLDAGMTATMMITVTVRDVPAGTVFTNTAQTRAISVPVQVSNVVTHRVVITSATYVYLPIILKNYPPAPPPPSACELVADITVGNTPRGVAIDETRNRVYVANYGSSSVSVIDSASNTVLQTLTGITSANGIAFQDDPTNPIIWVTNHSSNQVTPIQADSGANNFTVLSPISVGTGPWGVAYDPVHNYVYVVNNTANSVTVIDVATRVVVTTLSGNFSQPYHTAANPVTGKVYVPNFGDHTVTVIEGITVSRVVNLDVGDPSTQPYGVAVDEMREVIYVATVDSHRVVAIGTIDGQPDQLLGWAEFHRGYFDPPPPHRPVPMRAIAVNPDIGSIPPNMDDGGHVWTTTSTSDGSEANQALLIPKGWISYFHSPVPCNVGVNATEGLAIDRNLDRAYITSGTTPGTLTVYTDDPTPPLVPFEMDDEGTSDDGIGFELFIVE